MAKEEVREVKDKDGANALQDTGAHTADVFDKVKVVCTMSSRCKH